MQEATDEEKVRICCNFINHAPPGEFNEVFNDVRHLLNNDQLLQDKCAGAFAKYSKEQFTPVSVGPSDNKDAKKQKFALVTAFNDLGQDRFYDPRSQQSFRYDHLRKEAKDTKAMPANAKLEPWRSALQTALDAYVGDHYTGCGTGAVFATADGTKNIYHLCIESHHFQARNFWNGRWRSHWQVIVEGKQLELKGIVKAQVHYYEDGNVQLLSSKSVTKSLKNDGEMGSVASNILKVIAKEEDVYQQAVGENYQTMSDTTFKALRRQLPVTRTKIDWNKISSYRIGHELNR